MSVINTMLKDLELRGSSEMESDAVLRGLSSNTHGHDRSGKESNYHLVGVLGVLVVVLVMVIIYLVSPLHLLVAEKDKQLVVEKSLNRISTLNLIIILWSMLRHLHQLLQRP